MKIVLKMLCLWLYSNTIVYAQGQITKKELLLVFKETLTKSRNFVPETTNKWIFDNSKNDYFKKDTIILNSARIYNIEYCKVINWSFYAENKYFVILFNKNLYSY